MSFNYSDVFVAISTNNIQILVNFYSQLLQKQATVYKPAIYAEFQIKKLRIAIFIPKIEQQREFDNLGSSMSLCIEIENLDQAIATLTKMGYPPPGEIITASHGREIYAYDPTGNRLILYESKKR
jgi:predicted enzyme related to lactoylglutathione lyase